MSVSFIQNSFGGGELSPSLAARADLSRYKVSVEILRNMFIHKHAAVSNRGGFRYVGETKESTVRLIPFVYSDDQAYVLEFGDGYMRVIKDGAYVINSPGRGTSIVESGVYQWTASASGSEYYLELSGGGDPSMSTVPEAVYEDVGGADTVMTKGTALGSLGLGEWQHGDNDTLGFDTIYVRLSDDVDPDTKADGYLESAYIYEVTDGETTVEAPGEGSTICRPGGTIWNFSKKSVITGVSNANPAVVTIPGHGLTNGDIIFVDDISVTTDPIGMDKINGGGYEVRNATATTIDLYKDGQPFDTTGYSAYAGGGVVGLAEQYVKTTDHPVGASGFDEPVTVYEYSKQGTHIAPLTQGTLGALQPGEFAYGDNDSIGYNCIYYRPVSNDTVMRAQQHGYAEAAYEATNSLIEAHYLASISYAQKYDVMYLTGDPNAARKLTRLDHDLWLLDEVVFGTGRLPSVELEAGGTTAPAYIYAVAGVTFSGIEKPLIEHLPAPVGGSFVRGTVTCGTVDALSWSEDPNYDFYRIYKRNTGDSDAFGLIAEVRGSTFTDANDITPDYSIYPKTARNPFGYYEEDLKYNAPEKCAILNQRLMLSKGGFVYGSVISDLETFGVSSPIVDTDAFEFEMDSLVANPIRWLMNLNDLIIGTEEGEYRAAGSDGGAITPTSISIKQQSAYGSMDNIRPVRISNRAHFVTRSKNTIRDMSYSFETNSYVGNDITIFSRHLFDAKEVVAWAYQKEPDSILWVVLNDGTMAAMSIHREQEIAGWHRHDTPNGLFKDIVAIPVGDGTDEIYVHVIRKVNGVEKSFIERLAPRLPASDDYTYDVKDAFMVDSGLTYDNPYSIEGITQADPGVITITAHPFNDGDVIDIAQVNGMTELNGNRYVVANAAANSFELTTLGGSDVDTSGFTEYESGGYVRLAVNSLSGLDHLEGETVDILMDGFVTTATVSSGSITLPVKASRVHAGLSYGWTLKTLSFAPITEEAIMSDKPRDIPEATVHFEKSRGVSVGGRDDETYEIEFRTDEEMGDPTRLYTGRKIVSVSPGDDAFDGFVLLKSEKPLPVTINAIIPKVNYGTM